MIEEQQQDEVVVEEQQPQPKKRQRRVLVDVTVISQAGEGALVQWMKPDGKHVSRGFVAAADVKDGKCDKAVLKAAHPYGVPWAKLLVLDPIVEIVPERVEDELHRRQIWTVADIEGNAMTAQHALLFVAGLSIGDLHNRGSKYERSEKDEGG